MQLRSTSPASRWCCVSFYGGYFGARRGHPDARRILAGDRRDYRSANVAKNFFSSLNGFAATLVFATQGAVLWPQTLALAAGTIAGGDRGLCRARHSAQRRARAGCRRRCGAHNRICVALLVLTRKSYNAMVFALCASAATRAVIALSALVRASTTVK